VLPGLSFLHTRDSYPLTPAPLLQRILPDCPLTHPTITPTCAIHRLHPTHPLPVITLPPLNQPHHPTPFPLLPSLPTVPTEYIHPTTPIPGKAWLPASQPAAFSTAGHLCHPCHPCHPIALASSGPQLQHRPPAAPQSHPKPAYLCLNPLVSPLPPLCQLLLTSLALF